MMGTRLLALLMLAGTCLIITPVDAQVTGVNERDTLFGNLRRALQRAEDGTMQLGRELQESIGQLGLQPGDQLLDGNGQPLRESSVDQFLNGRPNELRVLRNGNPIIIRDFDNSRRSRPTLGIALHPTASGVVITNVFANSAAARAGLRAGDEIISVNGQIVSNPESMIQVISGLESDRQVAIQYRRNGQVLQTLATLSSNSQVATDARLPTPVSPSIQRKLAQIERLLQEVRQELADSNQYQIYR